jgi:hypothetical protein
MSCGDNQARSAAFDHKATPFAHRDDRARCIKADFVHRRLQSASYVDAASAGAYQIRIGCQSETANAIFGVQLDASAMNFNRQNQI